MFEKMVVSTSERRKKRGVRFFVVTALIYIATVISAIALSVLFSNPRLADTSMPHVQWLQHSARSTEDRPRVRQNSGGQSQRRDPNNVQRLDRIIENLHSHQQQPPTIRDDFSTVNPGFGTGPAMPGPPGLGLPGNGGGDGTSAIEAPRPEPVHVAARPNPPDKNKPVRLISNVLQGKAIERVSPVYPVIAKQIKLQGEVAVEVVVSPTGQVESARVISGHQLLATCSAEAARHWRFEPTFLNGQPVRVTGIITFVFKL